MHDNISYFYLFCIWWILYLRNWYQNLIYALHNKGLYQGLFVSIEIQSRAQYYKWDNLISIKIPFEHIDFHTNTIAQFCISIYLNLNQKYLKNLYMYHFIIVFAISRWECIPINIQNASMPFESNIRNGSTCFQVTCVY